MAVKEVWARASGLVYEGCTISQTFAVGHVYLFSIDDKFAFLSFIARLNSPDHFFRSFQVQEILSASLFTSLGLSFRITLSRLIVFIVS